MKNNQCYRQGDLCFLKVATLPTDLEVSKTDILLQNGSGGNPHTFRGGEFYPKIEGQFVIGFLKAKKGCKLLHIEHGDEDERVIRAGELPVGFYEVRRQSEETINGLKRDID